MKAIFIHMTAGAADLLPLKAVNALLNADMLIGEAVLTEVLKEFVPHNCIIAEDLREATGFFSFSGMKSSVQLVRISPGDAISTEGLLKEVEFFEMAGYETEIIPGVSRIQAQAAMRRFPLTRRGLSHSFWVADIKEMHSPSRLFRDTALAAASTATLVLRNTGMYKERLLEIIGQVRKGEDALTIMEDDLIIMTRKEQNGTQSLSATQNIPESYGTI
ncbi:SAM-dependent methyltransferase [Anseongella ginsenosidimutans]|nr:SAM-dependent methyltransferase [Anseongella ginsenosidimutans]QEC51169.1 hypothetical protein FRZ59_01580 [Anseongella ginsenosidimutans]